MINLGKAANMKILWLRPYFTSLEGCLYVLYHSYQSQENEQEKKTCGMFESTNTLFEA